MVHGPWIWNTWGFGGSRVATSIFPSFDQPRRPLMAAYYTAPRRRAPSIQTPFHSQKLSEHDWDRTSKSSYIFPDPESAAASPIPKSAFSYSSNASFSEISMSELGSEGFSPFCTPEVDPPVRLNVSSPPLSSLPPSLKSRRGGRDQNLDRPCSRPFGLQNAIRSDVETLHNTQQSASHTDTLPRSKSSFRHPLIRMPAKSSLLSERRSQIHRRTPQYPIPFLSFFSSLLGVDDPTLDLLVLFDSRSPVLFSTENIIDVDFDVQEETTTPTAPHGVEKFLSVVADDSGQNIIRQGLSSLDAVSVGEYHLTSISSMWNAVTELAFTGYSVLTYFTLPMFNQQSSEAD